MHRDDTEPPAGAAKVLRVGIDADRVLRQFSEQRAEIVDESSVDVVGQQHQVGTLGLHQLCDLADGFLAHCHAGGIAGIDDEEGFDLRILQLLDFLIGVLEAVLLGSFDMHDLEVVVLEVRHLEIRREDRRAERNRVAGMQQPVGLQRFEDVAHRGRSAFDCVKIELAGRSRLTAHRPHQILVHNPFVMDQHSIRDRVIVADDRVDEFVDEGVSVKSELLDGKLRHRGKETGSRHVRMFIEPSLEPAGDAAGLRHSTDPGRMLHHTLALGYSELSKQEKSFARRGSNPIRISPAGIQESGLSRLGSCFR